MLDKITPALKFYIGLVGALAASLVGSFGPDSPATKVLSIVIALTAAAGVYLARNTPKVVDPLAEPVGDPNAEIVE